MVGRWLDRPALARHDDAVQVVLRWLVLVASLGLVLALPQRVVDPAEGSTSAASAIGDDADREADDDDALPPAAGGAAPAEANEALGLALRLVAAPTGPARPPPTPPPKRRRPA